MTLSSFDAFFRSIPYVNFLNLTFSVEEDVLTLEMPVDLKLVGNCAIPALHGGVLGGFMETAALMQIAWQTQTFSLAKTIDITIDYFRMGQVGNPCFATATLPRLGRRIIHAHATVWQQNIHKPCAALHGNFLRS